jgi:hypothetical protein
MKVLLTQNDTEIEVNESIGRLLIAQEYATEPAPTEPEPIAISPNLNRPSRMTESQARRANPELYSLRDEIAQQGVPVLAANVLAREIYNLKKGLANFEQLSGLLCDAVKRVSALEGKVSKLEAATPPHLQNVEKR